MPRTPLRPVYLVTLRRRAGISQAALSERAGVSQTYISKLERSADLGDAATDAVVVRLAVALDVAPSRLRFGPNPHATRATRREYRRRTGRLFKLIDQEMGA